MDMQVMDSSTEQQEELILSACSVQVQPKWMCAAVQKRSCLQKDRCSETVLTVWNCTALQTCKCLPLIVAVTFKET